MKIERHIHPVGQGSFYTEHFLDENGKRIFNVVYDCGQGNRKLGDKNHNLNGCIPMAFPTKNESINVLFISHFDLDHINGLAALLNTVKRIDTIVLPYLYPQEKVELIIKCLNKVTNEKASETIKLIIDPLNYIREQNSDTKIIIVEPYQEGNIDNAEEVLDLLELKEEVMKIKSNSKLKYQDWFYICSNFNFAMVNHVLCSEIKKLGIDITDSNDILSHLEVIKKMYTSYFSDSSRVVNNINTGSLCVISGTMKTAKVSLYQDKLHYSSPRPSCLYVGDILLENNIEVINFLLDFYNLYKETIGLIQVAHHGAKNGYSDSFWVGIETKDTFAFVSYGLGNKYKHPYALIRNIFHKYGIPLFDVINDKDTRIRQCIQI